MATVIWPTNLIARSGTFYRQSHSTVFESPFSRAQQVQARAGDRFVAQYEFFLPEDLAREMDVILYQLKGPQGTVRMWDHRRPTSSGTQRTETQFGATIAPEDWSDGTDWTDGTGWTTTGTPHISFGAAAGSSAIQTAGWYPGDVVAKKGEWVQIGNDAYLLMANVTANDNGEATLSIVPPLKVDTPVHDGDPDNPTTLSFTRVSVEMRLISDDEAANPADVEHFYSYTLRFVEVLV